MLNTSGWQALKKKNYSIALIRSCVMKFSSCDTEHACKGLEQCSGYDCLIQCHVMKTMYDFSVSGFVALYYAVCL